MTPVHLSYASQSSKKTQAVGVTLDIQFRTVTSRFTRIPTGKQEKVSENGDSNGVCFCYVKFVYSYLKPFKRHYR